MVEPDGELLDLLAAHNEEWNRCLSPDNRPTPSWI
jgi:hypothetical protein